MTDQTTTPFDSGQFADAISRVKEIETSIREQGAAADLPAELIAEALYVAARLFSARTDTRGKTEWFIGENALNATETVVLVTALLEAADINLFDMAIWYRRP